MLLGNGFYNVAGDFKKRTPADYKLTVNGLVASPACSVVPCGTYAARSIK